MRQTRSDNRLSIPYNFSGSCRALKRFCRLPTFANSTRRVYLGMPENTRLQELATEINSAFSAADSSRLLAGQLLLEARREFDATKAEGDSWRAWCAGNVKRSYRDVKRVMGLARAPDPVAAVAAERAASRASAAASRAKGTCVCPPEPGETDRAAPEGRCPSQSYHQPAPCRPSDATDSVAIPQPSPNMTPTAAAPSKPSVFPQPRGCGNDKIYTNPEYARKIIEHFFPNFGPEDTFLDPCAGAGAFLKHLPPGADWCEIDSEAPLVQKHGPRDFLDWEKHYTWAITNPPWSSDAYPCVFYHALETCDNIVFLIRMMNALGATARRKEWESAGFGLKEIVFCRWKDAGFPSEGYELATIHWRRGYRGDVRYCKLGEVRDDDPQETDQLKAEKEELRRKRNALQEHADYFENAIFTIAEARMPAKPYEQAMIEHVQEEEGQDEGVLAPLG